MLTALLLVASAASAHFIIQSPPSRPFDDDGEAKGPCGNQPLGARTHFPITGGSIIGDLFHPTATANFSIVIGNTDPLASQFGQVFIGPGSNVQLTEGEFSAGPIDLSKVQGAVDGASGTIQVALSTVDGLLYQCIDVTLDAKLTAVPSASITPFSAIPDGGAPATTTTANAPSSAKASSSNVPASTASTTAKSGAVGNAVAFVALAVAASLAF
ncbi:hypothetical protein BC830DRAFT_1233221 [Chytriomyces sp. MP71]|nr:hypothetical protein BC830DRAFT_1233221 [Chytriomyces sp. MP71]